MADALASGASVLRDVGVQVPLRPHDLAVSRTAAHRVTNSLGFVTFVFGGVLMAFGRQKDNLPAGPAVPPVRCPPSGVNPTVNQADDEIAVFRGQVEQVLDSWHRVWGPRWRHDRQRCGRPNASLGPGPQGRGFPVVCVCTDVGGSANAAGEDPDRKPARSVIKRLKEAGFTRTSTDGRHSKWTDPAGV